MAENAGEKNESPNKLGPCNIQSYGSCPPSLQCTHSHPLTQMSKPHLSEASQKKGGAGVCVPHSPHSHIPFTR